VDTGAVVVGSLGLAVCCVCGPSLRGFVMQGLSEWLGLVGLVVEDPVLSDAGVVSGADGPVLVVSVSVVVTQCAVLGSAPVEPLEAALAVDYEASAKLWPGGWPSAVLEAGAAL
jgi:hypothetical protein